MRRMADNAAFRYRGDGFGRKSPLGRGSRPWRGAPLRTFLHGFRFSRATSLVTEGRAFYNPSNTALETAVSFYPSPRYSTAKKNGCVLL